MLPAFRRNIQGKPSTLRSIAKRKYPVETLTNLGLGLQARVQSRLSILLLRSYFVLCSSVLCIKRKDPFLLGTRSDSTTSFLSIPSPARPSRFVSRKSVSMTKVSSESPGATRVEEPYFWLRSPAGMLAFPLSQIEGSVNAPHSAWRSLNSADTGPSSGEGSQNHWYEARRRLSLAGDLQNDLQIIR
jgi:hypothetical protein